MKLMLIIVANEDASKVTNTLIKEKHFVTKLASTGGLLMNGNTTLLVGTENEQVEKIVSLVGECSKTRKQSVPQMHTSEYGMFSSYPIEVQVGGATIFVLDVNGFYKL